MKTLRRIWFHIEALFTIALMVIAVGFLLYSAVLFGLTGIGVL